MVAPVLEEIATEYADKIAVVKLNIDENPAVSQRYGIMAIPTMNVFSGGQVVKQIVGSQAQVGPAPRAGGLHLSDQETGPSGFREGRRRGPVRATGYTGRRAPWGAAGVIDPSRRSRATSTSSRQVRTVRSSIRSRG